MTKEATVSELLLKIADLENRLEESEQLAEAIKAGEVDAFAINTENEAAVYTLQSGDYAYRILVEAFKEGAINVSEDGLILYTNSYFCELLGLSYDKIIGTSLYDFIDPGCLKDFRILFQEAITGISKGEILLAGKHSPIPVYVSLTSLRPKLTTVGIVITDLTEQKRTENLIKNYQTDLENKNTELIQSNSELASFAYIASHDLQEPLRKIQTFASRITGMEDTLSDSAKDHFDRMKKAANRMQTLIEDLLNYSQTNSVIRNFEKTELHKLVEDVKKELAEELEVKEATVVAGEMCTVEIIPFQFKQLFHNLINNSLKFAHPDKKPIIEISSKSVKGETLDDEKIIPEKEYCHISIADNGIGFEPEYSKKIFDIFSRLHGREVYKGTGIGLAIVKKITDNHEGIIRATGEPDKGARFDIYLPARTHTPK